MQDKDESSESLCKGIPVVSLSIGDTADFVMSRTHDEVCVHAPMACAFRGTARLPKKPQGSIQAGLPFSPISVSCCTKGHAQHTQPSTYGPGMHLASMLGSALLLLCMRVSPLLP
eukprot:1149638-Pelagomonas_calceolata.AAC.1